MSLVRRIALALVVLAALATAAAEAVEVLQELEVGRDEMEEEHRRVGATFAGVLGRLWASGMPEPARALLSERSDDPEALRLRLVWLDGRAEGPRPRLPPDEVEPDGSWHGVVRDADRAPALVTYVPLTLGGRPAALELSEGLGHERVRLQRALWRLAAFVGGVAALLALASLALGRAFVAEPVGRLVGLARRIGQGDLGARVDVGPRRDELGELALEMNRMGAALGEARVRLEAETAARLSAEAALRHADRLTTVGKLAAGVAHELGTPLNVAGAHASLIASGEVRGEEALASARAISEQTRAMARTIRQLLDFARRRAPARAREDAGQLAAAALELLRPLAHRRGLAVALAPPAGPLPVDVDAGQVQQVLTNLGVNALQATPPGGPPVRLEAAAERRPGERGEGPARDWVVLSVVDGGAGIPPELLPRVFEPFFTTKDVGEGTGLGLSVSYGLVQDHGGFIEAQSAPGAGSRFSVYLPAPPAAAPGAEGGT